MSINVDPLTFIISIPKADLTLIQSSPTEVLELNLNDFRLELRAWEDDEYGIIHPKTHDHNTEVSLSGLTFARVIEILPPYTITFEDGQYAVNLVGANSNVGDRVNVNQVSVRSSNSAGLISSPAIEFSEFGNSVTIDIINGEDGTIYPRGTLRMPSKQIPDALLIASVRGFDEFSILGDITIGDSYDIHDKIVTGQSQLHTTVTLETSANVQGCIFRSCTLRGILDGNNIIENARVTDISYLNGYIKSSLIQPGTIVLGGGLDAHFLDCWTEINGTLPKIDMGGSGQDLNLSGYKGGIEISNLNDVDSKAVINLDSGEVIIDSTVIAGTVIIRGVGTYSHTQTGTEIINVDALVNKTTMSSAIWDQEISKHLLPNTMGHQMYHQAYAEQVHIDTINGVPGTEFPTGTSHQPCKYIEDAYTIANAHFFKIFHIIGSLELNSATLDFNGYTFAADRSTGNFLTVTSIINSGIMYFQDLIVSGNLSGGSRFTTCVTGTLTGFDGGAKDCLITNNIDVVGNGSNYLTNCDTYVIDIDAPKEITLNGKHLNMIRCRGSYLIKEKTNAQATAIDLVAGDIIIDSSCTAGIIGLSGIFKIIDNSAAGCQVIKIAVSTPEAIWNKDIDA